MTERDPKVSARYRELPREDPPRHVDDAILAAARRAMGRKSRRPYYAVALAAVLILAVAITVQLERRQDGEPASAPDAPASPAPAGPLEREAAPKRERSQEQGAAAASPEQWLQGIADLRRQGRHEEAERQLDDFRKRYPDYRISPEMLERLKKPS